MKSLFDDWIDRLGTATRRRYFRDQNRDSLALLVSLAQQFAPTKIVELGTGCGASLRAWVHAHTGAEIVTVDTGGLHGVWMSFNACPFDLSDVRAIRANVKDLEAHDLWRADDRVLLYYDIHGESAALHVVSELIPRLPPGSLVVVDDVWASDFDFFDQDGFWRFFNQSIAQDIDPEQPHNRPVWWERYWGTGRPVVGFAEIAKLMHFVNRRRLDCRFESKAMWFYVGTEPMSIFTTCKPFHGQTRAIQENAIKSWTLLQPRPEIIILGNDSGADRTAQLLSVRHEPELAPLNLTMPASWKLQVALPFGEILPSPPFVSSIFEMGQRMASHSLVAYVNADIILGQRFMLAAQAANHTFDNDPFLMTGLRWDLMGWHGLDIGRPGWWQKLEGRIMESGRFHTCTGADYFVFRRGLWPEIPPYYIGQSAWDNWLIMDVVRRGLPVVDATPFVWAIHHGLERCDITDRRYKHNQEIWKSFEPQHGEGMIETAKWVVGPNGEVLKDDRSRTAN